MRLLLKWSVWIILVLTAAAGQVRAQGLLDAIMNGFDVEVRNQKLLNTPNLEFSPAIYRDKIVFVGNGRNQEEKKSKKDFSSYYDLYITVDNGAGELSGEMPFSTVINSGYHEGPMCFSADCNQIYFTRNNILETSTNTIKKKLSIFFATFDGTAWSEPVEILKGTDQYSFCHPALSQDGNRLYFSANLPGGYGGYDIYYLEKEGNVWSTPINAGPQVNTGNNELFPTVYKNNTLFFSSLRPGGMGGLDIYMTLLEDDYFSLARPLPPPINSESDDLGFVIDGTNQVGWFSSSRKGGSGQDDIYQIKVANNRPQEPVSMLIEQKIIVLDAKEKRRLNGVSIEFENMHTGEITTMLTNRDGMASLAIDKGMPFSIKVQQPGYADYLLQGSSGDQVSIRLERVDCYTITAYTNDNENLTRFKNVPVNFINHCTNDTISTISDENGKVEICFPVGCSGQIVASLKDFYPVNLPIQALNSNMLININFEKQKVSIVKEPIKVGGVLTLENIYYDFNKSSIRPGAERELNELITVMNQYPDMEVELVAHTDTRGDTGFNLKLSIERAETAKNYLVSNGISADRIKATGRGETQPRNRCKKGVNCTEEEHQFNRRTEVRILKK